MSTIRQQIDAALRQARLDRDDPTKTVIGMLKAKVLNELKSGQDVEENDELWLKALASYAKQLKKSMAQFEGMGQRGAEALADAQFELSFCEQFLPTKLDEEATEALVRKIAADSGITNIKMMGQLMGLIMRSHRDEVDPSFAQKAAKKVLGRD